MRYSCPMKLSPPDDHLPESFFNTLYAEGAGVSPALDNCPTSDALERLLDNSPTAMLALNPGLQCLWCNRAAHRWVRPEAAPPGINAPTGLLQDVLHAALLEALLPHLAPALRGLAHAFATPLDHPTDGTRWLDVQVGPDWAGDRVVGLHVYWRDVTADHTRHAQQQADNQALAAAVHAHAVELDASEKRFRLMAAGLRDAAIVFLDPQGQVVDWPPSAQALLGHSAATVLGLPLPALDPGARDDTVAALERAALLGQCETKGWRQHQNGQRLWIHTVLTALHDTDTGESQGYSCLMRDMTEVQRLEDLLRDLNHDLERRVAERTQQLQDINTDLEAFSYSVSHDLRAPLRHVGSFVALLRESLSADTNPTVQRHLDTIAHAATHMGQLIDGLLAFSKLGRAALNLRQVSLQDLLLSSLNRVQHDPTLVRPGHQVVWDLASDLPQVLGDGLLLSQVWDNLLSNALKYSRPREPARIQVGWRAGSPGQVELFVADNGVGFDPRQANQLFGVFQRLHKPQAFEGTGIGLALCRRIVERHGGRIWAESALDQGSTFRFSLPVA